MLFFLYVCALACLREVLIYGYNIWNYNISLSIIQIIRKLIHVFWLSLLNVFSSTTSINTGSFIRETILEFFIYKLSKTINS